MTKRRETSADQLALDLSARAQPGRGLVAESPQRANVVAFADKATIDIRRDAVRRVQEAGIFAPKRNT